MIGESYIDVKVIEEKEKTEFEIKIKEYLENGYKIQNSNMIQYINNIKTQKEKTQTFLNITHDYTIYDKIYYALLIKE